METNANRRPDGKTPLTSLQHSEVKIAFIIARKEIM